MKKIILILVFVLVAMVVSVGSTFAENLEIRITAEGVFRVVGEILTVDFETGETLEVLSTFRYLGEDEAIYFAETDGGHVLDITVEQVEDSWDSTWVKLAILRIRKTGVHVAGKYEVALYFPLVLNPSLIE